MVIENVTTAYFYIALFATVLFVLKLVIFSFIGGGDSEVVSDFNTATDADPSFNFISFQSVVAFFMGFGWMGYAGAQQLGMPFVRNLLVALAVGFIFMFAMAFLMFNVKKLEKNVKKDKRSAIGRVGRAYTGFTPSGSGQVEIEINGQLSVVNASNNSEEHINAFDMVKVIKVQDDLLYIEKVKK